MARRSVGLILSRNASLNYTRNLTKPCMTSKVQVATCRLCSATSYKKPDYTYEITQDPEEWKFVEWYLPKAIVPPPPSDIAPDQPTSSGWFPQDKSKYSELPYYIPRTKNHMMPVYLEQSTETLRKFTKVCHIRGDIWGLEAEIKAHLEELYKDTRHVPILTQVHEPGRWIKIRGVHMDVVAQFLLSKGL